MEGGTSVVEVLRTWEDSGALWRVEHRAPGEVRVALVTCDGREVVDRVVSGDPELLAFIGDRASSEEPPAR